MYHCKERRRSESDSVRRNGYEPIAQFDSSQIPPDYLVHEAHDGRLISDSYEIEWPKRPQFGQYAEESSEKLSSPYIKQTNKYDYGSDETTAYRNKGHHRKTKGHMHNYSIEKTTINEAKNDDDDNHFFVGAQTIHTVSKLLRQNDFRLYYQIPSTKQNAIPIHIPLYLAYMSTAGKIYHFPIACTTDDNTGRKSWRVLYGDSRPSTFATLSALVKYHKIYSYMDPKTGAIDTFPVWKGAIIDFDDAD
ncbi:hypothetical protein QQG55_17830 [Brugia pahangi]